MEKTPISTILVLRPHSRQTRGARTRETTASYRSRPGIYSYVRWMRAESLKEENKKKGRALELLESRKVVANAQLARAKRIL